MEKQYLISGELNKNDKGVHIVDYHVWLVNEVIRRTPTLVKEIEKDVKNAYNNAVKQENAVILNLKKSGIGYKKLPSQLLNDLLLRYGGK